MNFECPEIIGISNNIKNIRKLIERVAEMEVSVLICGETGVGKELIVQNLYRRSKRCGKPFVKVNCAALPDALVESEMFGYEQGAFTGALNSKRGKFQQANGGVLFLDEIGDMPFSLQSKLLHALQSGEFSPLGAENIVQTDAWIIAATNRNLEKDMAENKFRSDLYYRLSTINIVMEPLRNRPEDIPYLVQNLIQKYAKQFNGKKITIPKKETISMLCGYSWPGNVRELQNVVKRIIVLENEDKIIEELFDSDRIASPLNTPLSPKHSSSFLAEVIARNNEDSLKKENLALKEIRRKAGEYIEKKLIVAALEKTGGNRRKASKVLKISYRYLLHKIDQLDIDSPAWSI